MSSAFEYICKYFKNRIFKDEEGCFLENSPTPRLISGDPAQAIHFPPFLAGFDLVDVLKKEPLELRMVPTDDFVKECFGVPHIPILCVRGVPAPAQLVTRDGTTIRIHFDLLGSAFYILTRLEEYLSRERDAHDRFPASASHALRNNYLQRPVVDEYVEILWHCIKHLWPSMERKKDVFRTMVTHDVDFPFENVFRPAWKVVRSFGSDLLRRRDVPFAFSRAVRWFKMKYGNNWQRDPFYTFETIMDMSESHGLQSAFYFLSGKSNFLLDGEYALSHPHIEALLRRIHERGHEIGYHGSYETYRDPQRTRSEVQTLRDAASRLGITQERWGGRQHFLRWNAPITWRNYAEAGLNYDTTLSYADHAGFRCGTCHPFPVFDVEQGRALNLVEFPLIVMECSVLDPRYMNLSPEKALEYILNLKSVCRKHQGVFCLLWHNSRFVNPIERELYLQVLAG